MNEYDESAAPENPFCSRRIRPGARPFLFPGRENVARLVDRLAENAWRGQIVGPHGSGKSTLIAALLPEIEQRGRDPLVVELHDGCRRLPISLTSALLPPALLIVDGYEQLSRFSRLRLKRFCRRTGSGLLATAHAPVGLPDLFRPRADVELARRIVEQCTEGYDSGIATEAVAERFTRHGGNLREMLFDLYDVYEQRLVCRRHGGFRLK